jgi:hypothetical protein
MSRLRRDGVALFYEEAGVGELPMLLVHGLACDHTHHTPQLEHFSDDHRVSSGFVGNSSWYRFG